MDDFDTKYKNWAENIDFRPREVFTPATLSSLVAFIKKAHADNRRVRVLGSGWSFSDVANAHDYLVSFGALKHVLAFSRKGHRWGHAEQTLDLPSKSTTVHPPESRVLNAALKPQIQRSDRRFAHVLGGMTVKELYLALDSPQFDTDENGQFITTRDRWALPTMGASAGQAITGVVSTSTHGADFDLPPIPDMVRAIDLIAPDGTRHWFERAGPGSITDPVKLPAVHAGDPVPLTKIHYNDDEFLAVLVSMGCMGIIHSLIIELVPQFGLSQRAGMSTWRAVRDSLKHNGAFFNSLPPWNNVPAMAAHPTAIIKRLNPPQIIAANPVRHGLEVIIDPYRISDDYFNDPTPDRKCAVASRARSAEIIDDPPAERPGEQCGLLLSLALAVFESGGPGTAKNIVDGLIKDSRSDTKAPYPVAWSVMDTYSKSFPVMSLEIAIPTLGDKHLDLVDDILDRFDKLIQKQDGSKLAGAISLRFTMPSEAFLAIQNFPGLSPQRGIRICHIEIFCAQEVKIGIGGPEKSFGDDARGLKNLNDLEGNGEAFFREFEALSNTYGAHLHWGQMSLTNSHSPGKYARFADWKKVLDQLTGNGLVRTFDNDFTVRYRISRGADHWTPLSDSLLPGSPTVAKRDANAARFFPPTVFRNKEGCLEVLVIGTDGQVCWNRQTKANSAFLGWSFVELPKSGKDLGRNFWGRVAVGINRDDAHPEVFARNLVDQKIYHAWRDVKDKKWGDWTELDGSHKFQSSPDAIMAADKNLVVIARRDDNRILYRDQKVELGIVGWNSWKELPPPPNGVTFAGDPCIGQNLDQRLEIYTRDKNGFVWHSAQNQAKSDSEWSDWSRLGQSAVGGDPAVGRRFDGRLEVFARGAKVGLAHIRQSAPNNGYETDWSIVAAFDQPLDPSGRPCVILSRKNLQVALLTSLQIVFHFDQNNDNWMVHDLGGKLTSYPAIAENDNERLEVFSKFENDFVEHRWQDASFSWPS